MIEVKILGYHPAQRYAVRQTLVAVQRVLQDEFPDLKLSIAELKDWMQIERYTPVLSAPSLVVNGKLVCVGRFPSKQEVVGWLKDVINR
ncbi:MAG TPA: thioredoxin family protein [Anaerolineales bacterium]